MAFNFKQFQIEDDHSTMKVGTDAVLLGAWTDIGDAKNILEIGCGSGVISLMIAQRTNSKITAIDIDKESVEQATQNFNQSPWSYQTKAIHIALNEFIKTNKSKFDLIISNPPFFIDSLKSPYQHKNRSKHTDELSYEELTNGLKNLLSDDGKICLILPFTESKQFSSLALREGIHLNKQLLIKPKSDKNPNRVLLEFSFTKSKIETTELYLREPNNKFSSDYKKLCQDYYLNC